MKKVGFIGLGLMGAPMAANIARAGYPLTVFNRTADKAEPLRQLGARVAASPLSVASESEVVVTMLADADAVHAVLFGESGLASSPSDGMVLIDMSTIAPDQSRAYASRLARAGIQMVDAPVFGSTGPAAEGTLGVLAGGEAALIEEHRPLLETMGTVYHLGGVGTGALAKMCFNLMVASQVASLAEAMTLAQAGGLDLAQIAAIISGSGIGSHLIRRKSDNMVKGSFEPAFPLKHMRKDLGLMVHTAEIADVSLPLTGVIQQLFTAASMHGLDDQDYSAIFRVLTDRRGLNA